MLRVALRGLLAHKIRFTLTILSVVIGVSFVAGSFILTDSIDDAFTGLFETTSEGTDLFVRPASEVEDDVTQSWVTQREPLPASVEDEIEAVDGVASATGWVEGVAQIVGPDGDPLGGNGPPLLGFSWTDEGGPLVIQQGRPPEAAGEVVIDAVSAETTGYGLGDEVRVITSAGAERFTLVGVAGFGESDNLLGATISSFELEEARRLFGKPGTFDQVAVRAEEGVETTVLRDRVGAALGDRAEVLTTEQSNQEALEDIRGFLDVINNVLLGFAFVAMFVGAFIIANTFSITVAQRTREFALLRAVGASTTQVRRAVRGEALIIGVVASALGLLLGIGFAEGLTALLDAFGLGIPTGGLVLAPRTILWSFAVGIGVTLVATILPARRASRIPPVEAMRAGRTGDEAGLRRRTATGAAIAAVGVAAFGIGAFGDVPNAAVFVGAGAVVILLGVATFSPALAQPIARVVGALPARLGVPGRIARGNAARDRRRTAITASALMIGLALVSFATVFAASATGTVTDALDEQFRSDFLISTEQPGFNNLPPTLAQELDALDEFATVSPVRLTGFRADGEDTWLAGVEPDEIGDVLGLGVLEGDLAALRPGETFVQADLLTDRGWSVGDTIGVGFARTGDRQLTIAGTFENADLLQAPMLTPMETFERNVVSTLDAQVFTSLAEGVAPAEARAAAQDVLEAYPAAEMRDQAELRQVAEDQINQVLGLMTVMLGLAIIVALLGITNTLALAVFERTREIGLLRAVGMTRRQVKAMVRWESSIVAVFGAVLGVAVGTLFGWAVIRALEDEGFERLVVPGGQLVMYVLAAAVAGVLAAAFPARRAAKLDVLEAVTVE